MELDDLKKSWNAMDKQLQKENIVDEKQIAELISKYQAGAAKGINKLTLFQKMSVFIGIAFVVVALLIFMVDTSFFTNMSIFTPKFVAMVAFVGLTIIGGLWWDIRTYRFSRNTKVDEMSTVEVIERMTIFSKWIKCEIIMVSVWILIFFVMYYWVMSFYEQSLFTQLIFISFSFLLVSLMVYLIYKKIIYKHLSDVKKNLKELEELETK